MPVPAVGEGAEGARSHGVHNHDVPGQRSEIWECFQTEPGFILTVSLIIAILNIDKKNNLINTSG